MGDTYETKQKSKRSSSIARNPELRENQLINAAYNYAEKQIKKGTASSQIVTHFLKLGTVKAQLENEKLKSDLAVANAKIAQMESQQDIKELFEQAIKAMSLYSGEEPEENYEDDYY